MEVERSAHTASLQVPTGLIPFPVDSHDHGCRTSCALVVRASDDPAGGSGTHMSTT